MRVLWLAALLTLPLAHGSVDLHHDVRVDASSQTTFAPLGGGDIGTATLGDSATSADITLGTLPLLVADDVLDIASTDDTWTVRAQMVSFTGFGALDSITLELRDGTTVETQIDIAAGSALQSGGATVGLPTSQATELTASGAGSGSVTFDLVLEPDAGGAALRYRCTLTVG